MIIRDAEGNIINPEIVSKKAYGYTRVSTEEQVDGVSLDNQRKTIQEYANHNNYEIVGWYEELGMSAKTAIKHPKLMEMIKDCTLHKGEIDAVIAYDMARISRNVESYFADIKRPLRILGVKLLSATEQDDDSGIISTVKVIIGEQENVTKSNKVLDSMHFALRQGWWVSAAPLGYKLVHEETEERLQGKVSRCRTILMPDSKNDIAKNIAFLFKRCSEGDSINTLVDTAKKLGIRTKRGNYLDAKSLTVLLKNPVYAGICIGDKKE